MPVSLMSKDLAQAQVGHLNQLFYMFSYLKHSYGQSKFVFDTAVPNISKGGYMECNWSEFYPDVKEVIPPDAP